MTNMLCESAFFGVVISLLAYELGMLLKKKFGLPIFNPLLISPRTQEKPAETTPVFHRRKAQKKRLSVSLQKASFRVFHYSFTAPSVIPVTKYFCRNGYTISIGTRAMNTFAASRDLLEFCANC